LLDAKHNSCFSKGKVKSIGKRKKVYVSDELMLCTSISLYFGR